MARYHSAAASVVCAGGAQSDHIRDLYRGAEQHRNNDSLSASVYSFCRSRSATTGTRYYTAAVVVLSRHLMRLLRPQAPHATPLHLASVCSCSFADIVPQQALQGKILRLHAGFASASQVPTRLSRSPSSPLPLMALPLPHPSHDFSPDLLANSGSSTVERKLRF